MVNREIVQTLTQKRKRQAQKTLKKPKKEPSEWKKKLLENFEQLSLAQRNEIRNLLTAFTKHFCSEFIGTAQPNNNNDNEEGDIEENSVDE